MKIKAKEHAAYQAILAEARRVGFPTKFKRDLFVHDRRYLTERDPGLPFVWTLREAGTHLCFVEKIEEHGLDPIKWIRVIEECFEGSLFYFWDGIALRRFKDFEECARVVSEFLEARRRALVDDEIENAYANRPGGAV